MCYACHANGQGSSWASFDHSLSQRPLSSDWIPQEPDRREGWNDKGFSAGDSEIWATSMARGSAGLSISSIPAWVFSTGFYPAPDGTKIYMPTNIDRDTLALFSGSQWSGGTVTYSLPDSRSDYQLINPSADGFKSLSFEAEQAVRHALEGYSPYSGGPRMGLNSVESLTNLSLDYAGRNGANMQVAGFTQSGIINASHGYYPSIPAYGGDVWLQYGSSATAVGSHPYYVLLHELGHALGLKHSFEAAGKLPAISAGHDSVEYTVMTYNDYSNEPQTYMMYDIAALQEMYGADFSTNSGNTVYKWNPTTGETFVNGVGQGAPGTNTIFLTTWDGGGIDTYDFSSYTSYTAIDLAPGGFSMFSRPQLAQKTYGSTDYAGGNVYNSLLYHGDNRSLIENAIGGSGADHMRGNQGNNMLTGNAGNDSLYGLDGNDTLYGGAGDDVLDDASPWATNYYVYGNDLMDGGAGNDRIYGRFGNDTLYGGDGNDTLDAGEDNDIVYGGSGNDHILGYTGNDYLFGEAGNDTIYGGAGNDYLYGGTGTDYVSGDDGNDTLVGDGYGTRLTGGAGNDTFLIMPKVAYCYISDFVAGPGIVDQIKLHSSDFANYAAVRAVAYQTGTDVVIAKYDFSLILNNTKLSSLVADDFAFI
ncbi:M10 family metallopeptidase [Microvirga alba]|uniref:M10 family metallopeptidase C-terminal domain-containing protein n=1 Tax=Microvirga alba TaxID=2791025 RepID=A0A931FPJ3_9HYPH|nr:M10 family metallopeptidase [Microvirga alba]MBF9232478.1 M10 family metallopeptidase C-terminal domain-containing protein [Microvirga alba]